mmetsp:Transcript_78131/g.253541  ORF Transcript_78131/g.253541 Transcript_78131/m.253541 type:complete len:215 (-) Transcript_78131:3798-4442(-)
MWCSESCWNSLAGVPEGASASRAAGVLEPWSGGAAWWLPSGAILPGSAIICSTSLAGPRARGPPPPTMPGSGGGGGGSARGPPGPCKAGRIVVAKFAGIGYFGGGGSCRPCTGTPAFSVGRGGRPGSPGKPGRPVRAAKAPGACIEGRAGRPGKPPCISAGRRGPMPVTGSMVIARPMFGGGIEGMCGGGSARRVVPPNPAGGCPIEGNDWILE